MWWSVASHAVVRSHWLRADTLHCPHCGGECAVVTNEHEFFRIARRFEQIGYPRHEAMVRWVKGRCFKTWHDAMMAYVSRAA